MKISTGRIYLVAHEIKGVFYIDVKEVDETWVKGVLITRIADDFPYYSFLFAKGLIRIKKSFCMFILIDKEMMPIAFKEKEKK